MASLYKYLIPQTPTECLPDPRGPLSKGIPSSAITAANSGVKTTLGNEESKKRRGQPPVCYLLIREKKWKPAIRESLIPRNMVY